jgi:hypothetical protein
MVPALDYLSKFLFELELKLTDWTDVAAVRGLIGLTELSN